MLTLTIDLDANEWHENGCTVSRGTSGRAAPRVIGQYRWRRNGRTQTWKTRPEDFRIPIKYGMRSYDEIAPHNVDRFHDAASCLADAEVAAYWDGRTAR